MLRHHSPFEDLLNRLKAVRVFSLIHSRGLTSAVRSLLAPTVFCDSCQLPASGSPRIAEAMHANQSVASAEDDCSCLSVTLTKGIQRASPNDN